MNTYKLANSIFGGPVTNLLSVLCILIELLSRCHVKRGGGGGSFNDFKFGNFTGRFPSDCAASMAVKELRERYRTTDQTRSTCRPSYYSLSLICHPDIRGH